MGIVGGENVVERFFSNRKKITLCLHVDGKDPAE